MFKLVGVAGIEPATFRTPYERAKPLRHTPFLVVVFYQTVV